jgi:hypothetical protein
MSVVCFGCHPVWASKTNHRHTIEQKTKAVIMMADQTNRVASKTNHRHTIEQKTKAVIMMADLGLFWMPPCLFDLPSL